MTILSKYDKGDLVRVSGLFTNISGTATDPSSVTLRYKDPSSNVTTLVYGVDGALVKDSTGNYHVDINADESGRWFWRWESTGTGQAAEEGEFYVKPSNFA